MLTEGSILCDQSTEVQRRSIVCRSIESRRIVSDFWSIQSNSIDFNETMFFVFPLPPLFLKGTYVGLFRWYLTNNRASGWQKCVSRSFAVRSNPEGSLATFDLFRTIRSIWMKKYFFCLLPPISLKNKNVSLSGHDKMTYLSAYLDGIWTTIEKWIFNALPFPRNEVNLVMH